MMVFKSVTFSDWLEGLLNNTVVTRRNWVRAISSREREAATGQNCRLLLKFTSHLHIMAKE